MVNPVKSGGLSANVAFQIEAAIIEGKLAKFYEENCLMEQPFIKDESLKIRDLLTSIISALKVSSTCFCSRYQSQGTGSS